MVERYQEALGILEKHKAGLRAAQQQTVAAAQGVYTATAAELMGHIIEGRKIEATALMRRAGKELPKIIAELQTLGVTLSAGTLEQRLLGTGGSEMRALPEGSSPKRIVPQPAHKPTGTYTSLVNLIHEVKGTHPSPELITQIRKDARTHPYLLAHSIPKAQGFSYEDTPQARKAIGELITQAGVQGAQAKKVPVLSAPAPAPTSTQTNWTNYKGLIEGLSFKWGKRGEALPWLLEHAQEDPYLKKHSQNYKGTGFRYQDSAETRARVRDLLEKQGFLETKLSGEQAPTSQATPLSTSPQGNYLNQTALTNSFDFPHGKQQHARKWMQAHAKTDPFLQRHAKSVASGFQYENSPEVREYVTQLFTREGFLGETPIQKKPATSMPTSPPSPPLIAPRTPHLSQGASPATYSETSQPFSPFTIYSQKLGSRIPMGFIDEHKKVLGMHTGPGNISCYDPTKLHEIQRLWDTAPGDEYKRTH